MFCLQQLLKLEILIGLIDHIHEKEENVNIKNVTKDYGVLVLAGPKSRTVLISNNFSKFK